MTSNTPTACVLLIGNEILSGRTPDANLNYLAVRLGAAGIPVREARVVPDIPEEIISAVNTCRAKYTYVFTTGGIGPTHDDITAATVAEAFGVPLETNPQALETLTAYYAAQGISINTARARMAQVPQGARLLDNPLTKAPGFVIGNVHVLPGVPKIMQVMFDLLLPTLQGGEPVRMESITCQVREGDLADDLEAIQRRFPQIDIGSYPGFQDGQLVTQLVCKGTDAAALAAATAEVAAMVQRLGKTLQAADEHH